MSKCKNCVLDETVSDLVLLNGVCQYCRGYKKLSEQIAQFDLVGYGDFLVDELPKRSKNPDYDCIVGISGGLDSSYLLEWIVSLGLRPYVLHIDTCWNSNQATKNIYHLVSKLGLKLHTTVVDWPDLKIAQYAFLKAGLLDCDVPQDHCFTSILSSVAKKTRIRNVISGHNLCMEYVLPHDWSYNSNDSIHIEDVVKKVTRRKLNSFPFYSPFKNYIERKILKSVISYRPFLYYWFDKDKVKLHLEKTYKWEDYGGKHYECDYTKFFQGDYLIEKFGIDKRKAHYSNLIVSGQLSRETALQMLKNPPMEPLDKFRLRKRVKGKLGFTDEEWEQILSDSKQHHESYRTSFFLAIQKMVVK